MSETLDRLQAAIADRYRVERPIPLSTLVIQATLAASTDSGLGLYRQLREQYYGRNAYDFGERSLNIAAFRVAREQKSEAAMALLAYNVGLFPNSSGDVGLPRQQEIGRVP